MRHSTSGVDMKELPTSEEVYESRTSTNGSVEWFGTVTGKHIYQQKEVDFNISEPNKNYLEEGTYVRV